MSSSCSVDSSQNGQTERIIAGVKISFPGKPYPSQISMMEKVIISLKRSQSCLLESPTGSGKTLALLCASLAWQKAQSDGGPLVATEVPNEVPQQEKVSNDVRIHVRMKRRSSNIKDIKGAAPLNTSNRDEDFQVPKKTPVGDSSSNGSNVGAYQQNHKEETSKMRSQGEPGETVIDKPSVPKIFFGTRTHKQIAQVIRELRKTVYTDIRMTVLASREHTCIHPRVSKHDNKSENCRDLIKNRFGDTCKFYRRVQSVGLEPLGPKKVWDIEDMVQYGTMVHACPYYLTREILESAQIVFCPYNYLTDPKIRKAMDIRLENQVVIIDEAHNIEDVAREAASFSVTNMDLFSVRKDLEEFLRNDGPPAQIRILQDAMSYLNSWMLKEGEALRCQKNFGEANHVWPGLKMVAILGTMGLGPDRYTELIKCMASIAVDAENQDPDKYTLSSFATGVIEGLLIVLKYLYRKELAHMDDYRVALVVMRSASSKPAWMQNSHKYQGFDATWTYTLNFWCQNPAVSFCDISEAVRSIVLTSGTLSPMKSFQSELGVNFSIKFEANHVIEPSQAWIGQVSTGPNRVHLNGNYQHSQTFVYQDEIGEIVLRVCSLVPHGVLCFFSSYNILNKLCERWQVTGMLERMKSLKVVFSEPRGSQKGEFQEVLDQYYRAIEGPLYENDTGKGTCGALLLAVCRGKVSEGLDFSDNNARAVITVGIPFPCIKDLQVSLKKAYNNENFKEKEILTGNEWYEIQAFRALNQALGRCIRHKEDWGALFLVDARFQFNTKYQDSLSRWVRTKLQTFENFNEAQDSLHHFVDHRKSLENAYSKICDTKKPMSPDLSFQAVEPESPLKPSSSSNKLLPFSLNSLQDKMAKTVSVYAHSSQYKQKLVGAKFPNLIEETRGTSQDNPVVTIDDSEDDDKADEVSKPMKPTICQRNVQKNVLDSTSGRKRTPRCNSRRDTKRKKPIEWEDGNFCRAGVWCSTCGQQLTNSLEGVKVSPDSPTFNETNCDEGNERKYNCKCVKDSSCTLYKIFAKSDKYLKENCQDQTPTCHYCKRNAFWSDEDKMCFEEMQCKSCKTVIGYKILAVQGKGRAQYNQVWFASEKVEFCLAEKSSLALSSQ